MESIGTVRIDSEESDGEKLRCEESENILFILSAKTGTNSHMANYSPGD